jgi:hypothetical protein
MHIVNIGIDHNFNPVRIIYNTIIAISWFKEFKSITVLLI